LGDIWLVRHAPTALSGVCYGQSNVPVTLEPAEAARMIAQRWEEQSARSAPELWTSPWARTRPVAEELARHWRTTCRIDARLSELSFGIWEGSEFAEIERTDAQRFQSWMHSYEIAAPPGGETVTQLRARVADWLSEASDAPSSVLAVTHAGVIRVARALTRGLEYSDVAREGVPHLVPEPLSLGANR
jgi:alpha-ribazole phosphatase